MKLSIVPFLILITFSCSEEKNAVLNEKKQQTKIFIENSTQDSYYNPSVQNGLGDQDRDLQEIKKAEKIDLKKYQGEYAFTYVMGEYTTRGLDFPVKVIIDNDQIILIQDKEYISGGDTIYKSKIYQHVSGKIIISDSDDDINAEDIGPCTGIPILNFEDKKVEAC